MDAELWNKILEIMSERDQHSKSNMFTFLAGSRVFKKEDNEQKSLQESDIV